MSEKQKTLPSLVDIVRIKPKKTDTQAPDYFATRKKNRDFSVFFSKNGIVREFFTDDSKLYITPFELKKMRSGGQIMRLVSRFDGAFSRDLDENNIHSVTKLDWMALKARRKYLRLRKSLLELAEEATDGISMAKMWNLSIVGAVIFGMFTMTMIYRYLGQNVSAKMEDAVKNSEIARQEEELKEADTDINDEIDIEYITRIIENEDSGEKVKKSDFEKEIMNMVAGYPIEKMVPEIVKQDRVVAAFLIAIAKKESNWGKRVPVLNGQDCYNYWGYRGIRDKMGTGGHTCFDSPKDAVETVGKRIEYLVSETKRNTADKMVVWKCGYDCSWDSKTAVRKWISDVDLYFKKLNKE